MSDTGICKWCKEPQLLISLTYQYCIDRESCIERRKTIMDKSIPCELVEIRHENFKSLTCLAHIGEPLVEKLDGIFGLPQWYCEKSGKILAYTALETYSE